MHKTFKNIIKHEKSRHSIRVMYYKGPDEMLMIAKNGKTGGALWAKETGEAIVFQSPSESLDEIFMHKTVEEAMQINHNEAIEQGYTEICKEEFMQILDEKYPGWREPEP